MNEQKIEDAKILVVDDEFPNVLLIEKALEREAFTNLFSTTDPIEVLGLHKKYNFDLILLDISMPVLDGFGVIENLKSYSTKNIPPIIVVSAVDDVSTKIKMNAEGVRSFIEKPVEIDDLIVEVKSVLSPLAANN